MAQPSAASSAAGEGAGAGCDEVSLTMKELGLRNADRCGACGASAALIGSTCRFCRCRFCLKHAQAEAHGCGSDASKTERAAWLKAARDGAPPIKPSDVQVKVSKQKLAAKLGEAAAARKPGAGRGGGGGRSGART